MIVVNDGHWNSTALTSPPDPAISNKYPTNPVEHPMTGEPRIEHQLQSPCQQTKLWKQVALRQVALCHFRHQSHLRSRHPPPFQCFSPGATMIAMRIQKGATTWRVIQVWQ